MPALLVTAEHASNHVPSPYGAGLPASTLASHRAYDPGTADLARRLAKLHGAPLIAGNISRLLVDLNRSADNPRRWSPEAQRLPTDTREALSQRFHVPHWQRVAEAIAAGIEAEGSVIHVAVHSFTPSLEGRERTMDVAFLYDPARGRERALVDGWQAALAQAAPDLVLRRNAPYRGVSDGLTRGMRLRFDDRHYAGIELEVNQKWLVGPRFAAPLARVLLRSTSLFS